MTRPIWEKMFSEVPVRNRAQTAAAKPKGTMAMITSAHLAVKGFLYQAVQTAALPYFMDYLGCSPMEYQAMIIIVWTPWAMKGVIGIFSDLFPILGYHKRPYIAASAILGTAVLLLLAALPLAQAGPAVAPFAALLMALCMLEQALVDLLVEGKYAEKMAERPETGPDLVTWVWANYQTGVLLAAALVGTLADAVGPRAMYAVASVFALQVVFPALKGYLPEERLPRGRRGPRWALAREHRGTFLLALAMSASAVGLSLLSLYGSNVVRLAYGLVTAAALNAGAFLVLPRAMAKANVYMFFTQCTYILLTGALDYFYTGKTAEQCAASATCRCYVREGPHFSATYYLTVAQVLAPRPVDVAAQPREVSASSGMSLLLDAEGAVWSWGPNFKGRDQSSPSDRPGRLGSIASTRILQVSAGRHHALLLTSSGGVLAFGNNSGHELGTGNRDTCVLPTAVARFSSSARCRAIEVSAGDYHSAAVDEAGAVASSANASSAASSSGSCGCCGLASTDTHPIRKAPTLF